MSFAGASPISESTMPAAFMPQCAPMNPAKDGVTWACPTSGTYTTSAGNSCAPASSDQSRLRV